MTFEIGVAEKESSANLPFVEIGRRGNVRADGDLNKRRVYDLSELFCAPQVRYRRRPPTLPEKGLPDSRFKSRPPFFWKPLSRNKKIVSDSILGKSKVSCTLTATILFDLKLEMSQNKSVALFAFTLQEQD